ncbi:uncharacterized protein V1510DRAFT_416829 [Dipodascopsis tothii]|uniref:uncharacterized protein n=1 Tax=Dipodascopsis tothii TaxID=44089 RepID=UPI0034CFC687
MYLWRMSRHFCRLRQISSNSLSMPSSTNVLLPWYVPWPLAVLSADTVVAMSAASAAWTALGVSPARASTSPWLPWPSRNPCMSWWSWLAVVLAGSMYALSTSEAVTERVGDPNCSSKPSRAGPPWCAQCLLSRLCRFLSSAYVNERLRGTMPGSSVSSSAGEGGSEMSRSGSAPGNVMLAMSLWWLRVGVEIFPSWSHLPSSRGTRMSQAKTPN